MSTEVLQAAVDRFNRNEAFDVHPVAELFPRLAAESFDSLVKSIGAHGLREPVVLDVDPPLAVVDGRNRLHRDFCAYLDHLATVHQRLVTKYREANEEARSVAAPKYFHEAPKRLARLDAPALSAVPELDDDAREAAVERMRHFIKEVNEEMTKYGAAYRFDDLPRPVGAVNVAA